MSTIKEKGATKMSPNLIRILDKETIHTITYVHCYHMLYSIATYVEGKRRTNDLKMTSFMLKNMSCSSEP